MSENLSKPEIIINNVVFKESDKINGIFRIQPKLWPDDRGFFMESFNQEVFNQAGLKYNFVQDNHSRSSKNVLRGLHFQLPPYDQTKLVRVVTGQVLDIAVDIRPESITFGQYEMELLDSQKGNMFLIPRGFAHGFAVISETADFLYKCDNNYNGPASKGLLWNDPAINIQWPSELTPILSDKDQSWPTLAQAENDLKQIVWNK